MNNDNDLYHLIANPLKINRDKLIKKKYPQYLIEDKDYNIILNNLEEIFIELNFKNLINNFVNNIIEDVLNE